MIFSPPPHFDSFSLFTASAKPKKYLNKRSVTQGVISLTPLLIIVTFLGCQKQPQQNLSQNPDPIAISLPATAETPQVEAFLLLSPRIPTSKTLANDLGTLAHQVRTTCHSFFDHSHTTVTIEATLTNGIASLRAVDTPLTNLSGCIHDLFSHHSHKWSALADQPFTQATIGIRLTFDE